MPRRADTAPDEVVGLGEGERLLHPRRQARAGAFHRAPPRARRAPPGHPADRVRRSGDPAVRPARRAEVGPRGRRGRRTRLDGRARPGRPCAREEPHGSGSPAPRRSRPGCGRRRAPGHRGRGGRGGHGGYRGRRGGDPVRRQDEHLGQASSRSRARRARWSRSTWAAWIACFRSTQPRSWRASRRASSAEPGAPAERPGLDMRALPDSFTHSTLGGWIATRSSGMQSDRYGDVAELTRGLRVVTPSGVLVVRPVPSTSTGPSVREMVLGSRAGSASSPRRRSRSAGCRPSARSRATSSPPGRTASRRCATSQARPHPRSRVSDPHETGSFATRADPTPVDRLKSKALQAFLKRKGWDREAMCLSFIGYEGSATGVAAGVGSERIAKRHGALCIGSSPRALRPEEVRHALHPRLPARPRRTRRRLGDLGAMGRADGLRQRDGRRPRRLSELGVPGYLMC